MSKYTTEQLQEMAKIVMTRAGCSADANIVVARLQARFGLTYDMVMLRICDLSMGLPVDY